MFWLTVALSAYFLLAVVFLVDKYLLTAAIPNPKVYAFYVGTLGISALLLAPFIGFYLPEKSQLILSLLSGFFFVYGLFWFYKTLRLFEASRVVPAVGGLTPLFTLGLIYFFSSGQETLPSGGLLAFVFLVAGSILLNLKKGKLISLESLKFSALAAFLLSLSFVSVKYVYLSQPFWNGFIWRSVGGFLTALFFLFLFPEIRREILKKKEKIPRKTATVFLTNQAAGAAGNILQNWAVALAPLAYVPLVNALQGIQYVFLLILAAVVSSKFPAILKEETSWEIIFQKTLAILLMAAGLAILAF
jgi:drug/metabolite transporter (DMT)-like permease